MKEKTLASEAEEIDTDKVRKNPYEEMMSYDDIVKSCENERVA